MGMGQENKVSYLIQASAYFFFFSLLSLDRSKKDRRRGACFCFFFVQRWMCLCTLIDLTDWSGLKTRLSLPLLFSLLSCSILFVVC
ncbi:hypothetical protein K457DRAFT_830537 [Linnemannia elongata AG-77]|uniref:Uncharacterized protein n=1 Tax=Linnemannia elongata AG-77 TaxID=1314771 RepID=A0A197JHS0_9FUNG|nr:hypothetical protein K457DRAFT_830537 [Linnemannia elongata AG-77]